MLYQSRISSLVYSVWSFLYNILYKDRVTVTYLSFLTHTPQLWRRVYKLQITVSLQALKVTSIKSIKSSLYCSYMLLFIKLQYLYSRILNLIQLLILFMDVRSTPQLYFFQPLLTYLLVSAILCSIVQYIAGGRGLVVVCKGG